MHAAGSPLHIEEDPARVAQQHFMTELERRRRNVDAGRPPVKMMQSTYNIGAIHHYKPNFDLPEDLKKCAQVLIDIMNHEHGYWFNDPVDWQALNIPDYPQKVPNPMDLGTVKGKLEHDLYNNVEEFDKEISLVWNNCKAYNHKSTVVYQAAAELEKFYTREMTQHFGDKFREPEIMEGRIGKIKLKIRLDATQVPTHDAPVQSPFSGVPSNSVSLSAPSPKRPRKAPRAPTLVGRQQGFGRQQGGMPTNIEIPSNEEVPPEMPAQDVERIQRDLNKLPGQVLQLVVNELYMDTHFRRRNPNPDAPSVAIDLKNLESNTLWECRRIIDRYLVKRNPLARAKRQGMVGTPGHGGYGGNGIVLHHRRQNGNGHHRHEDIGRQSHSGNGNGGGGLKRKRSNENFGLSPAILQEAQKKKMALEASNEADKLLYGSGSPSSSNRFSASRLNGPVTPHKTFNNMSSAYEKSSPPSTSSVGPAGAATLGPQQGGGKLNTFGITLRDHGAQHGDDDSDDSSSESESEMDSGSDSDDDRGYVHFVSDV